MRKVLIRFNMHEFKSVATPIGQHLKLSAEQSPKCKEEKEEMEQVPYASEVGNIMYGMVCSRPNLAYDISVVSRFMANPGFFHWEALLTLWYLRSAKDVGLMFKRQGDHTHPMV